MYEWQKLKSVTIRNKKPAYLQKYRNETDHKIKKKKKI
jgi:hypothetical protein